MLQHCLGFHTFTGCDITGKFNWKFKLYCWKQFLNFSEDEDEAFSNLENSNNLPSEFVIVNLQQYMIKLYLKKTYKYYKSWRFNPIEPAFV